VETIIAQLLAALLVIGSYLAPRFLRREESPAL
jgi:hypothetical protein